MKQAAVVYTFSAVLAIGAGVAIGGLPSSGGGEASAPPFGTIAPPATTVPSTTVPATTVPVTTVPDTTVPDRVSRTTTTTSTSATTSVPDTTVPNEADESADEPLDQGGLAVATVNASGIGGVAGAKADELEAAGYVDVAAVNAVLSTEASVIYFAAGLEREAMIAAADLDWGGAALLPMDEAPELRTGDEFDLLVVIGTDRAEPVPEP